jgi:hypothetical protein
VLVGVVLVLVVNVVLDDVDDCLSWGSGSGLGGSTHIFFVPQKHAERGGQLTLLCTINW